MSLGSLKLSLVAMVLMVSVTAEAFELKRDSTGGVLRWGQKAEFVIDQRAAELLGEKNAFSAVQAAVEVVDAGSPGLAVTVRAGETLGMGFDFTRSQNQNEILVPDEWTFDTNAIAVTVITADTKTHTILDADIAFNVAHRRFRAITDPSAADAGVYDDIQNTLTHELGHAVGLAHNHEDPVVVMYPSARRGETHKRVLSGDDQAGLEFLYPANGSEVSAELDEGVGCSVGGNRAALWMMLLAVPLFLRRRVGSRAVAAAVVALPLAVAASPGQRAEAPAARAQLVATARVVSSKTLEPVQGQRLLHTEIELSVRECLKGDCQATVKVLVPGGRRGNIEQYIEGSPVPTIGEVVGVTLAPPRAESAKVGKPRLQLYRLEAAVDFIAFAKGLQTAGLKLKLPLPGSASPRPVAITPGASR
jgi:hypothetical protein